VFSIGSLKAPGIGADYATLGQSEQAISALVVRLMAKPRCLVPCLIKKADHLGFDRQVALFPTQQVIESTM